MHRNHFLLRPFSMVRHRSLLLRVIAVFVAGLATLIIQQLATLTAPAQTQISPELKGKIEKLVENTLAKSGVPSASVAIVKDGQIIYLKASGDIR